MTTTDRISARPDNGILFYVRRVPKEVAHLDKRGVIRQSLKTRDLASGTIKARALDESLEAYWAALLQGANADESLARHRAAVDLVASMGFTYRPKKELVAAGLTRDLADRIYAAEALIEQPAADALLGDTGHEEEIRLSTLYDAYAKLRALYISAMSPKQQKQHANQRERAVRYAIAQIGDKALGDISRADVLRYREWWVKKTQTEKLTSDAANKSFANIKGMLTIVDRRHQTEHGLKWMRINLEDTPATKVKQRPPYSNEFVQDDLLAPGALDGLNADARMLVYLMVETGLRLSEACNLRKEDIVLDAKIPYVSVAERNDRVQKTEPSIREIPLVGVSLWAAKQRPGGVPRYHDKGDSLSATINKYLRENGLRPTPRHSVYSLRHNFQDRLLAAQLPDRVQADLMGHEFGRQKYGDGASLEQKLEALNRIKFRWPASS